MLQYLTEVFKTTVGILLGESRIFPAIASLSLALSHERPINLWHLLLTQLKMPLMWVGFFSFAAQYKFYLLLSPMFGLLRILGCCFFGWVGFFVRFLWVGLFGWVFLANHWSPLSVLRLPACLYVVNTLSKSYFSYSQFCIVEIDFLTQKNSQEKTLIRNGTGRKWRESLKKQRDFLCIITRSESSASCLRFIDIYTSHFE